MAISHRTVSKLYDKMIQSFNFPFPEYVVFNSEKLDIFSFASKNFRLFNQNLWIIVSRKNMLCKFKVYELSLWAKSSNSKVIFYKKTAWDLVFVSPNSKQKGESRYFYLKNPLLYVLEIIYLLMLILYFCFNSWCKDRYPRIPALPLSSLCKLVK